MFSYVPSFVRAARSHKYEKNDGVVNTDLVGSRKVFFFIIKQITCFIYSYHKLVQFLTKQEALILH